MLFGHVKGSLISTHRSILQQIQADINTEVRPLTFVLRFCLEVSRQ